MWVDNQSERDRKLKKMSNELCNVLIVNNTVEIKVGNLPK